MPNDKQYNNVFSVRTFDCFFVCTISFLRVSSSIIYSAVD